MLEIIANLIILFGAIFCFIACLGLVKMKNFYLKIHSVAKIGTLGNGLIMLGVGLQIKNIASITEVILLIIFISLTNPLSSHLIAKLYFKLQQR